MSRSNRSLHMCAFVLGAFASGCVGSVGGDGAEDGGEGGSAESGIAVAESPLSLLTRVEYERTARAVFGDSILTGVRFDNLPTDLKSGAFESNGELAANVDSVDAYRTVAEDIGEHVGAQAAALLGCEESEACVAGFIEERGLLLFRRPLATEEAAAFQRVWSAIRAEGSLADAMRVTVSAFLQSPEFLYRLEKGVDGGEVRKLDGYEVASRLSFFLWKSGPDRALLDAAGKGELDTPAGLERETRRLLGDARADFTLLRFHEAWLGMEGLERHKVDAATFPEFESLKSDMIEETEQFILHVMREDDARFETLFTASYSFASPELATFYGDGVASGPTDGRVALDASQRMGLLTQASFLTANSPNPTKAAIRRGKRILVDMLCNDLALPDDVDTVIEPDPTLSSREQIEQKTSPEACAACHSTINPMGFPFDNYDAIGRFRTKDGDHDIDATGEIIGTDVDGKVDGAIELVTKLSKSDAVTRCATKQWMRYALGRKEALEDEGSIEEASAAAVDASGDIRELIVAITLTDAFRHRRLPAAK